MELNALRKLHHRALNYGNIF